MCVAHRTYSRAPLSSFLSSFTAPFLLSQPALSQIYLQALHSSSPASSSSPICRLIACSSAISHLRSPAEFGSIFLPPNTYFVQLLFFFTMLDNSSSRRHPVLEEHDYIGLSQASLADAVAPASEDVEGALQDTDLGLDLGLGLGLSSGFSKREAEAERKRNQVTSQLDSSNSTVSARLGLCASKNWMKRGFSETTATPTSTASEIDSGAPRSSSYFPTLTSSKLTAQVWQAGGLEKPGNVTSHKPFPSTEIHRAPIPEDAPPAKDRVVGWPPVRSYRRQTLVKPAELFVKVNMDGMTVGRKVDLNAYNCYESLLVALEDMFQPSSNSQGTPPASLRMDSDVKHFLLANGSDFVLTYEDKDGDWMLVGDVPWSLFVSTVRRLRIMRGLEATGSGSRALGK